MTSNSSTIQSLILARTSDNGLRIIYFFQIIRFLNFWFFSFSFRHKQPFFVKTKTKTFEDSAEHDYSAFKFDSNNTNRKENCDRQTLQRSRPPAEKKRPKEIETRSREEKSSLSCHLFASKDQPTVTLKQSIINNKSIFTIWVHNKTIESKSVFGQNIWHFPQRNFISLFLSWTSLSLSFSLSHVETTTRDSLIKGTYRTRK